MQIGRMLDIDLISEPPHAPSPPMYVSKVWKSVWPEGQEAIHSYLGSQDVTYLSLHTMLLPPRVEVKGRKLSFCPPLIFGGGGVGDSLVSNDCFFHAPVWRQHSDTRFLGKEKRVKGKGRHFFSSKIEPATSIFVDHEG